MISSQRCFILFSMHFVHLLTSYLHFCIVRAGLAQRAYNKVRDWYKAIMIAAPRLVLPCFPMGLCVTWIVPHTYIDYFPFNSDRIPGNKRPSFAIMPPHRQFIPAMIGLPVKPRLKGRAALADPMPVVDSAGNPPVTEVIPNALRWSERVGDRHRRTRLGPRRFCQGDGSIVIAPVMRFLFADCSLPA